MSNEKLMTHSINATNLADILERVLDKGIVIAGDIKIQIADIDLLTIKIRLLIASVDKALEMGINWWQTDAYLSTKAKETELEAKNTDLLKRIEQLESRIKPAAAQG
ncbi:MAG: gas vesicle protein [Verrucomicrobia bacterium]|nr:gas vesicle protein [Verrucomicrobiota bacterium]MBU1735858.1 gas vesicle protein [Verrucomicrobiota bacterium]MBU1857731.1 gas vesicle protein [Verrucomicrobiota bacterium]